MPDQMTFANRLRKASTVLTERLENTTKGRWKIWGMQVRVDQVGNSNLDDSTPVANTYRSNDAGKPRTWDADYIATMDPNVGTALRDLLGEMARIEDDPAADYLPSRLYDPLVALCDALGVGDAVEPENPEEGNGFIQGDQCGARDAFSGGIRCTLKKGHGIWTQGGTYFDHGDPSRGAFWRDRTDSAAEARQRQERGDAVPAPTLPEGLIKPYRPTFHVTIGNSDDKLSQARWARFVNEVDRVIRDYAHTVHGQWFSAPDSRFQNAIWAFEVWEPQVAERVKHWLARVACDFEQDSIAINESEAAFITPLGDRD